MKNIFVVVLLVASPVKAVDWRADAEAEFRDGRVLTSCETTRANAQSAAKDAEAASLAKKCRQFLEDRSIDSTLSVSERRYFSGAVAFLDGRRDDAVNDWHVYRELQRRDPEFRRDGRWNEVEDLFYRMKREQAAEELLRIPPLVQEAKITRKRANRKRPRERQEIVEPVRSTINPTAAAKRFGDQARRAHRDGQLEVAAKLYRLALKIDPHADDLRSGLDAVERDMK
jgi:hypothetical protein